jgi:HEAT repeat protein
VVPRLIPHVREQDLGVRLATFTALERFGPRAAAAVPALTRAIGSGDAESRMPAMRTLAAIGTDGVPALAAVAGNLSHPNPQVRQTAAEILGRFGPLAIDYVGPLKQLLQQTPTSPEEVEVRRAVSEALLKIRGR